MSGTPQICQDNEFDGAGPTHHKVMDPGADGRPGHAPAKREAGGRGLGAARAITASCARGPRMNRQRPAASNARASLSSPARVTLRQPAPKAQTLYRRSKGQLTGSVPSLKHIHTYRLGLLQADTRRVFSSKGARLPADPVWQSSSLKSSSHLPPAPALQSCGARARVAKQGGFQQGDRGRGATASHRAVTSHTPPVPCGWRRGYLDPGTALAAGRFGNG